MHCSDSLSRDCLAYYITFMAPLSLLFFSYASVSETFSASTHPHNHGPSYGFVVLRGRPASQLLLLSRSFPTFSSSGIIGGKRSEYLSRVCVFEPSARLLLSLRRFSLQIILVVFHRF